MPIPTYKCERCKLDVINSIDSRRRHDKMRGECDQEIQRRRDRIAESMAVDSQDGQY